MNKIRLALVLEATEGGTWTHLDLLVNRLDRHRFDLTVICSTLRDPSVIARLEQYQRIGVQVRIERMQRSIHLVQDPLSFWRMCQLMAHEHFDIVHTHSSKAGFLGRMAAKCAGVPIVMHTPHVFAFQQTTSPVLRGFYVLLERIAARATTAMICVCEAERDEALRREIISPERLFVVPNSISFPSLDRVSAAAILRAQLGIAPSSPVIGTVSNYRKQKALHDFIQAAALVRQSHPEVIFLMIGSGKLAPALKARVAETGMERNLRMVSSPPPIWNYYACMDVFALSSMWEAMPYAVLEAMAMARPVVVTAVGGCREIVDHGHTGLLVPPGDPLAMAQAMCLLLENEALRLRMGIAAQAVIRQRYRVEDRIRDLESIYERALRESSSSNSPVPVRC